MAHTNNADLNIALAEHVLCSVSGGDVHKIYIGTFGASYEFDCDYDADNSKIFTAQWTSKDLDFTDQFQELRNHIFTVECVILEYVDVSEDTPVTVYVSKDGGVNWNTKTLTLGTGDGKQKIAKFWMLGGDADQCTGKKFMIRISSSSETTRFVWTGINIIFYPRGKYQEVT